MALDNVSNASYASGWVMQGYYNGAKLTAGTPGNISPYQYYVRKDENSIVFSTDKSNITMNFLIGWWSAGCIGTDDPNSGLNSDSSNVIQFCSDIAGWSYADDGTGAFALNTLHRIIPQQHPEFCQLYCSGVSVMGKGTLNESATSFKGLRAPMWRLAEVKADFSPVDYRVLDDLQMQNSDTTNIPTWYYRQSGGGSGTTPGTFAPSIYGKAISEPYGPYGAEQYRFTSRKQQIRGEMLGLPQGIMQYATDGANAPTSTQPTKRIMSIIEEYTWHQVPPSQPIITDAVTLPQDSYFTPPNLSRMIANLGKVNNVTFDPAGRAYAPGTVLFIGAEARLVDHIVPCYEMGRQYLTGYPISKNVNFDGGGITSAFFPHLWEIKMLYEYKQNGFYGGSLTALSNLAAGWNFAIRVSNATNTAVAAPYFDLLLARQGPNAPTVSVTTLPSPVVAPGDAYYVSLGGNPLYEAADLNSNWNIKIS